MCKTETWYWKEIRLFRCTWIPLRRVPGDVDAIDTNLLAYRMRGDNDTGFALLVLLRIKGSGFATLGCYQRSMGQKPVRVAGILQLRRNLCPPTIGVLVQQLDQTGSGHANQSCFICRMKRADWPTAKRRICPTPIYLGRLEKCVDLTCQYTAKGNERRQHTERCVFNHIIPTTWFISSSGSKAAWRWPAMLLRAMEME